MVTYDLQHVCMSSANVDTIKVGIVAVVFDVDLDKAGITDCARECTLIVLIIVRAWKKGTEMFISSRSDSGTCKPFML